MRVLSILLCLVVVLVAPGVVAALPPVAASAPPLALDRFGGVRIPGFRPADRTGFFHLEKISHRWVFITPDGNPMLSISVSGVDGGWPMGVDREGKSYIQNIEAKYAIGAGPRDGFAFWRARWAYYARARLRQWGFNTIGTFSNPPAVPDAERGTLPPSGSRPPNTMPYIVTRRSGGDAMRFGQVKNIYASSFARFWTPYFPDVFDPRFQKFVEQEARKSDLKKSPWVVFIFMDQTDEMRGVEMGHPHLGFVVAAANDEVPSDPRAFGGAKTYSDPKLYSKYALRDFLKAHYHGDLAALNKAWGTAYTSWDSDGSWGTGSGLLDENGAHLGSWTTPDPQKPGFPAVRADLDAFAAVLMRQWYRTVYDAYKKADPNCLLATNNMNRPKPYVYEGLRSADGKQVYADLINVSGDPDAGQQYMKLGRPFISAMPYVTAENDSPLRVEGVVKSVSDGPAGGLPQLVITADGDQFWWAGNPRYHPAGYILIQFSCLPAKLTKNGKPSDQFYRVIRWNSPSQFTVAMSSWFNGTLDELRAALKPGTRFRRVVFYHPDGPFETQEERGAAYARTLLSTFQQQAPNGDYFYAGANQWAWVDTSYVGYFESSNFGLVTLRDNAYDGVEDRRASSKDPWGFPRGGETRDYGDFLGAVTRANHQVDDLLRRELVPPAR